jgi:hypothetical protein
MYFRAERVIGWMHKLQPSSTYTLLSLMVGCICPLTKSNFIHLDLEGYEWVWLGGLCTQVTQPIMFMSKQ